MCKDGNAQSSAADKLEIAKRSFEHILDMDVHLDAKANRTLGAIAFLTAALATVFGKIHVWNWPTNELEEALTQVLSPQIASRELAAVARQVVEQLPRPYSLYGVNWTSFFFSLYLLSVLLGAVFYLGALGRTVKLRAPGRAKALNGTNESSKRERDKVASLLFYRNIASLDAAVWSGHWSDSALEDLRAQLQDCYISESRVLARRADEKYRLMRWGNTFFQISLFLWVAVASGLWLAEPGKLWLFLIAGMACLGLAIIGMERIRAR